MRTVDPAPAVTRSSVPASRARGGAPPAGGLSASRVLTELVDVSDGWASRARCRGEHAALFFGPNQFEPKNERLERETQAKEVCATCPVVSACRDHALRTAELYGVWGGLGENDRRAMLANRGRIARAV